MSRRDSARGRADIIFLLYYEMGVGGARRNLRRLHRQLQEIGYKISIGTLRRYSANYDWPGRAAERDAEVARARVESSMRTVLDMQDRHAQLARSMFGASATGLRALLNDPDRVAAMTPTQITRMVDAAARMERSAVGDSAERRSVLIGVTNLITRRIVPAFIEINDLADADDRKRQFIEAFDRLIAEHLIADAEEHPE